MENRPLYEFGLVCFFIILEFTILQTYLNGWM